MLSAASPSRARTPAGGLGSLGAWTALGQPREEGAPAKAPEGQLIDRVVAIIEGQVLTQSELEFETRVALIERGAVEAVASPLDEETLRGGLELVIGQRLLVLSADRLEAFPAEQAEVESRLVRFRRNLRERGGVPGLPCARGGGPEAPDGGAGAQRAGRTDPRQPYPAAGPGGRGARCDATTQHASEYPGLRAVRPAPEPAEEERYDSSRGGTGSGEPPRRSAGGALRAGDTAMRRLREDGAPESDHGFLIRQMTYEDMPAVIALEKSASFKQPLVAGAAAARTGARLVHHPAGGGARAGREPQAAGAGHLLDRPGRGARAQRGHGPRATAARGGAGGDGRGARQGPPAPVHPGHTGGAPQQRGGDRPLQSLGFRSVGVRPNYYVDEKEDAIVMILDF